MKKTTATFLLMSSFMLAQGTRTPPDPATIAQREVAFLTLRLSLTAAQQADALKIFTTAATAEAGPQADLRAARQNLQAAVKTNATGAISNLAVQIGNDTAALTSAEATANAAFYQILTADQQTKFGQRGGPGRGFDGLGPQGMRGHRQ